MTQYQRERKAVPKTGPRVANADAPLTRAEVCRQIQNDLDEKTTLLVETGDAWFNGMFMHLPDGARFEIEMQWGSIGWAVPASFGYATGLEPDRKLVSMIGDGSFQLTAQEVANMIRYGQNNGNAPQTQAASPECLRSTARPNRRIQSTTSSAAAAAPSSLAARETENAENDRDRQMPDDVDDQWLVVSQHARRRARRFGAATQSSRASIGPS